MKKGESAAGALAVDRRSSSEAEQAPDCAGGWAVCTLKEALEQTKQMDLKLIPYELSEGMMRTRKLIESAAPGQEIGVFIGPEGGFEEAEVELAMQSGFMPVTLGKRILRTETAGLTVMAWLMYQLEDSGIS